MFGSEVWGFSYQFWPWLGSEEVAGAPTVSEASVSGSLPGKGQDGERGRLEEGRRNRVTKRKVLTREVSQTRVMLDPNPPKRSCSISMWLGNDQAFSLTGSLSCTYIWMRMLRWSSHFAKGIQRPTLQIRLPKRQKAAVDASSRFSP